MPLQSSSSTKLWGVLQPQLSRTPSSPLCSSIFLTSVPLVSSPRQELINHWLQERAESPRILAELTKEQKRSQGLAGVPTVLWGRLHQPGCHRRWLPHRRSWGRLALGCVDLMKHAGKRIIGGQPAPKACPELTHERKALSAFQDLDPYRTSRGLRRMTLYFILCFLMNKR